MIHLQKLCESKEFLRSMIDPRDVLVEIFELHPDLQQIVVQHQKCWWESSGSRTRITEINGIDVKDPLPFQIDYDFVEGEICKLISEEGPIPPEGRWLGGRIIEHEVDSSQFWLVQFDRKNYVRKRRRMTSDQKYFAAALAGKKLHDSFFLKVSDRERAATLAIYHALDHGRFKTGTEFKLFARRGLLAKGILYARYVIKGRLPEEVENFFILDSNECEKDCLRAYIAEFVSK